MHTDHMILGKIYPKRKDVPTANLRRFGDDIMGITCHIRGNYGENSLYPDITLPLRHIALNVQLKGVLVQKDASHRILL